MTGNVPVITRPEAQNALWLSFCDDVRRLDDRLWCRASLGNGIGGRLTLVPHGHDPAFIRRFSKSPRFVPALY